MLKSIKGLFTQKEIEQFAKEHGVDMDTLPTKEEINQKTLQKASEKNEEKKRKIYFKHSLWSGNRELDFTFKDWNVDLQTNRDQARALGNQAFTLAQQLRVKSFNVALLGDKGVGKTSLALAMLSDLKAAKKSVIFVSTAELLNLINRRYDDPSLNEKIDRIKRSMIEADVLVLDDFGTEGSMTASGIKPVHKDMQDLMYQVANARVDFNNNKVKGTTIITTNNTQSELEQMYDHKLINRLFPDNAAHQLIFEGMKGVRNV